VPDTDAVVCTQQGKQCGSFTGTDNCGNNKTFNCGTCSGGKTCSANLCVVATACDLKESYDFSYDDFIEGYVELWQSTSGDFYADFFAFWPDGEDNMWLTVEINFSKSTMYFGIDVYDSYESLIDNAEPKTTYIWDGTADDITAGFDYIDIGDNVSAPLMYVYVEGLGLKDENDSKCTSTVDADLYGFIICESNSDCDAGEVCDLDFYGASFGACVVDAVICTPFAPSCGVGEGCYYTPPGYYSCQAAGTVPVGGDCLGGEQCVAGAECFYLDSSHTTAKCLKYCEVGGANVCSASQACDDLEDGDDVGVCWPP